MDRLYQILEYKMTQLEAKAFKLCLIWEDFAREYFPRERCGKLPKKGDPRKSFLFKCCYKLIRETKGLILDDQYRVYIRAQFDLLKSYQKEGQHANIAPNCLNGKNAWIRWKKWLSRYDSFNTISVEIKPLDEKIVALIKKTKEFLLHQYKKEPTLEDIQQAFDGRAMIRWLTLGKICGYYPILSPFMQKCLKGKSLHEAFKFDLTIYESHITPEIEEFFKEEFNYEFGETTL